MRIVITLTEREAAGKAKIFFKVYYFNANVFQKKRENVKHVDRVFSP